MEILAFVTLGLIIVGILRTPRPYILLWSFAIPIYYLAFGFKNTYIPLGFTRVEAFSGFLPIVISLIAFKKLTITERQRTWKYAPKVWLLFLAYYSISLAWGDNFSTGIRTVIQLIFPTILFFIAFNSVQSDDHLEKYFKYLIILNAIVGVFDLYYTISDWTSIFYSQGRTEGVVGYRTVTGYFYVTMSIILLLRMMDKFETKHLLLFALNLALLILAASRTPTVTFLAGAATAIVLRRSFAFTFLGAFSFALLIGLIMILPSKGKFFTGDEVNTRDSGRAFFQGYFERRADERPTWGYGAGGSETYAKWISQNVTPVGAPHNEYLRVRFDGGYIGLILFYLGIADLVLRGLYYGRYLGKYYHFKAVLVLTPVMFAVSCTNDNTFFYFYVFTQYLFTFMGFAMRLAYEERVAQHAEHLVLTLDEEEFVRSLEQPRQLAV